MKLRNIVLFIVLLAAEAAVSANPARFRSLTLTQPNGYTFQATFKGDEFLKIIKTIDGCAVAMDDEGWWCYAYYDADGSKHASGARIGTPASPSVMDESRMIPYAVLVQKALEKRACLTDTGREPLLKRVADRQAGGIRTKAGTASQKHGIAILAQYKDVKFRNGRQNFEQLLNAPGYNGTGSAMDYFNDQFHGMMEFTFDVSEIVTLPQNRDYYGSNKKEGSDSHPGEMIYDACRLADSEVDFSKYDDDGDGYVDNVFVFFAGEDESQGASENCIWSHAWTLSSAKYFGDGKGIYTTGDGVRIDSYACTSELARIYTTNTNYTTKLAGIGTFCHEYSHTLGLPDFYDTDYEENGEAAALWHWTALMDGGNHNNNGYTPPNYNCIEREIVGLSEPEDISGGHHVLEPVNKEGKYLRLQTSSENDANEYYLIECRDNGNGWDRYIGGSGLLVYHIDKTDDKIWKISNTVNTDPSHQYADLIEADNRPDRFDIMADNDYYKYIYDIKGIFFPAGSEKLSSSSHPSFMVWNGGEMPYSISNISRSNDGSVSFDVVSNIVLTPKVRNLTADTFPDAAIIQWEASCNTGRTAYFSYGAADSPDVKTEMEVPPYSGTRHSVTLEKLSPGKSYYVTVRYDAENGDKGEEASITFTTDKAAAAEYPYIYLKNVKNIKKGIYLSGTKMPLRIANATDAVSVVWETDGKEISVSPDGYYTFGTQGTFTLKAEITYKDGSTDIVTRQITIK